MALPKMHITCITASLASGGAEKNLLRLAQWLTEEQHVVTVLTLNPEIADFYQSSEGIIRKIAKQGSFRSCPWYDLRCQRRRRLRLRESILETVPELVISFIDTTNIAVLSALRGTAIPVIVSERTEPRLHQIGWRWSLLRRWHYPRADKVVFVTQDSLNWASKQFPGWNGTAIANAVVLPDTSAKAPTCFAKHNWVAMGRLSDEKRFDLLITVFAELAPKFPYWNLTILGEGPEFSALSEQIIQLALQDRVHLTGVVAEPFAVLKAADAFVLTSRYEGFPNVLLEAMACGLPVVSFACPSGPSEIISRGEDGLLVASGDSGALREAMHTIMDDGGLRKNLAHNAPRVLTRFSEHKIKNRWLSLLDEIMRS